MHESNMPISSDEVNYLVYRYLKESGNESIWSDKRPCVPHCRACWHYYVVFVLLVLSGA